MSSKYLALGIGILVVLGALAYAVFVGFPDNTALSHDQDAAIPQQGTWSGTYACLPHADTTGPQTEECAFGFKTDDGAYYALDFGTSTDAASAFQSGTHATIEGTVVAKAALNTDYWNKYQMEGILTVQRIATSAPTQGKLNITAVCEGALSYMTFADGASADAFVKECEEGKHPEVIERYKAQMNLGDGATI